MDPNPRETNIPITGSDLAILQDYPPCPLSPRAPGEPAPLETRSMVAARFWEQQVALPVPKPAIAPGRAITGKLAYLETKGKVSDVFTDSTVFGPVIVRATGAYTVDWGDGTTTGPHSFEGGEWPDGKITHQYTKVGTYNVVVTEKWTAQWSLDGESGTLRTLQTTGRINNFPVEQIQAVIGR
ncbi:MAG TPA: PKD domain-containing protein [Acidimicrobiales bacterium]|nr:PKD domain-containing protein [Acidimicrobiales bacterium]